MSKEPEEFTGRIIFMSMFNDIIMVDPKKMNGNANANALSSFLCVHKDFHQDNGHSSDLDQKRSGILLTKVHKENGTESQK